jgi:cell division protein FtsW
MPKVDGILIFLVLVLSILGILNFFSASYYYSLKKTNNQDGYYFLKEFLFKNILLGFIFFIFGILLGDLFLKNRKIVFFLLLATYSFIILGFLPVFRLENASASRWVNLGIITFQPSEIIKPFLILFFIFVLDNLKKVSLLSKLAIFVLLIVVFLLPIFLQPSLSNVLIILMSLSAIFLNYLKSFKEFFSMFVVLIVLILILILLGSFWNYRKERIISFFTKGETFQGRYFQIAQSEFAVLSGGLFGKGIGNSDFKIIGIPQMLTDSIFAIYAEENGFIGSLFLIFLFFALILRIIIRAINTQNQIKKSFCLAVAVWIFCQTFLHIGSNIALIVPTGVILPFFSSGASGQLALYFSLGTISKNG